MLIPHNFSSVSMNNIVSDVLPVRLTAPQAQNLIVHEAVRHDFEWVVLLEENVIPPPDLPVKFAGYMREGLPVVSGLYCLKGIPSDPVMYRGRGTGLYLDWKPGDKVWVDGVPTGCLLIHGSILRAMWEDSPEYEINGETTREAFVSPIEAVIQPDGNVNSYTGTSDLEWCSRITEDDYMRTSGWTKYARQKYPFMVDTSSFCGHITQAGAIYPPLT